MRKARVLYQGQPAWGELTDEGVIRLENGAKLSPEEADFLPPVTPSKIVAVHVNYPSRLKAFNLDWPRWASYFLKAPSALNSHGKPVYRPTGAHLLNYEGEIAIVLSKRARNVPREEALGYIAGYSAANDYGLHDFRACDSGSLFRDKCEDSFCPIGPYLVTPDELDPANIRLTTYVNGKVAQDDNSSELIFGFDYLIADLSRLITLEAGDVILTGSPVNSRPVEVGDVVEVEVGGLCRLTNVIRERQVDWSDFGARPEDTEQGLHTAYKG